MASDIRVVKEQLGEFAGKVETESSTMSTRFSNNAESLFSGNLAAGTSRMPAARALYADHATVVDQFGQYMTDQTIGLTALNMGALSIQTSYTSADDESANGMRVVDAAFNPTDGTTSVQSLLQEVDNTGSAGQVPAAVQDALPPADDLEPETYRAPDPSEPMPGTQDPSGQALTHDQDQANILYGTHAEDGPGGQLDTTGLDQDLENTYDDAKLDAALLQGMTTARY